MKHKFTKLMAIVAVLLMSAWSVNAQTPSFTWDKSEITTAWANASAASIIKVMGGVTLEQIGTAGVVNNYIDLNNSNSNLVLNATGNDALTITSTDVITKIEMNFSGNSSSNTPNPYFGFHSVGTSMGSASATVSSCLQDATGVTGTTGVTKTYIPPSGTKFAIIVRGKACDPIASSGATARIYNIKVYTQPASPSITKFVAEGVEATINEGAKTITAELPYGTNLTSIEPVVTTGGTATGYSPTGAQDFTNPVTYTATDGTNNVNYTVTLTVPASPPAPTITKASGSSSQMVKVGNQIESIVYNLTNVENANVSGLPQGVTANFVPDNHYTGVLTISGTVDGAATPNVYDFTVNTTPITGYTGLPVTSEGSINVLSSSTTVVLYLASDATTVDNDLFLAQLTAKPNFVVVKRVAQANFTGNYDLYDLIVLHESLAGGDAATTGHELRLIKDVDKPILNTKSYFYTSTARWNWGTPNNGNSGKGMQIEQPTHPIFAGITYTDSLYIYNTLRAKNIQPVVLSVSGYEIAKVPGGVSIHDLPASIRVPSGSSKYVMISLLNGAYNDLTTDALKLLDNAVNYLISGTQFNGIWSKTETPKLQNISFDGSTIFNPDRQQLHVYSATGSLVASSVKDINMSAQAKGVYLVKGENGMMKIAVTK